MKNCGRALGAWLEEPHYARFLSSTVLFIPCELVFSVLLFLTTIHLLQFFKVKFPFEIDHRPYRGLLQTSSI